MPDCFSWAPGYKLTELVSELGVSARPTLGGIQPATGAYRGIWDTGASGTVIAESIVTDLGLKQFGVKYLATANGVAARPTYFVDLHLPNGILVPEIEAPSMPTVSGGFEVLIGMDVIGLGDFSVTNHGGHTTFGFRTPSQGHVNYVDDQRRVNVQIYDRTRGRNDRVEIESVAGERQVVKWKEAKPLLMEGWCMVIDGVVEGRVN